MTYSIIEGSFVSKMWSVRIHGRDMSMGNYSNKDIHRQKLETYVLKSKSTQPKSKSWTESVLGGLLFTECQSCTWIRLPMVSSKKNSRYHSCDRSDASAREPGRECHKQCHEPKLIVPHQNEGITEVYSSEDPNSTVLFDTVLPSTESTLRPFWIDWPDVKPSRIPILRRKKNTGNWSHRDWKSTQGIYLLLIQRTVGGFVHWFWQNEGIICEVFTKHLKVHQMVKVIGLNHICCKNENTVWFGVLTAKVDHVWEEIRCFQELLKIWQVLRVKLRSLWLPAGLIWNDWLHHGPTHVQLRAQEQKGTKPDSKVQ